MTSIGTSTSDLPIPTKSKEYEGTDLALLHNLDLFQKIPVSNQIKSEIYVPIQPVNLLDSNSGRSGGSLQFRIFGDDFFLDLHNSYFIFNVKIIKQQDGSAVSWPSAKVGPVNGFGHSLIRNLTIRLDNVSISPNYQTYAFSQYLQALLNFDSASRATKLQTLGWSLDIEKQMDKLITSNLSDPTAFSCENSGLLKRRSFFHSDGSIQLYVPLNIDLASQPKYLLNKLNVDINLHLNSSAFALMHADGAADEKYDFQLTKAELYLCKIELQDATRLALETVLSKYDAIYEYNEKIVRLLTLTQGQRHFSFDPLFSGIKPLRLHLALGTSSAVQGKSSLNPYNFQHFGIESIRVYQNAKSFPYHDQRFNFETGEFMQPFMDLHRAAGCDLSNNNNISLTRSQYATGGFCIFSYEFQPSAIQDSDVRGMYDKGPFRIDLRFKQALTENLTAILYLEFPAKIRITKSRNVITSQSQS